MPFVCRPWSDSLLWSVGIALILVMGMTPYPSMAQERVARAPAEHSAQQNLQQQPQLTPTMQGILEDMYSVPYYAYLRELQRQGRAAEAEPITEWMMKNDPATIAGMIPPFGADDGLYHNCGGP